jgi:hypothetical protein
MLPDCLKKDINSSLKNKEISVSFGTMVSNSSSLPPLQSVVPIFCLIQIEASPQQVAGESQPVKENYIFIRSLFSSDQDRFRI